MGWEQPAGALTGALRGCSRVYLANAGTSPEAVASALARLAETGLLDETCIILLTTPQSATVARKASEILSKAMDFDSLRARIIVDADAGEGSVYTGIFDDPSTAIESLRRLMAAILREAREGDIRLIGADITGGTKLMAGALATLTVAAAMSTGEKRAEDQAGRSVYISYAPGEAFSRPGLRQNAPAGWWGGRSYPHIPRPLQKLILVDAALVAGKPASGGVVRYACMPGLLRLPERLGLVLDPDAGLSPLLDAVAWSTRVVNAATCGEAAITLAISGRRWRIATIDWQKPALELDTPRLLWDEGWVNIAHSYADALGVNDDRQVEQLPKCFSRLARFAVARLAVRDASGDYSGLRGRPFSEAVIRAAQDGRGIVLDTNALYNGAHNSLLEAETIAALRPVQPQPRSNPLHVPSCALRELRNRLMEEAKQKPGLASPCFASTLLAHQAASGLPVVETPGEQRCDYTVYEMARKEQYIVATSDTGIANLAKATGAPLLHLHPSSPAHPDQEKPWTQHQAAAAAAQLIAYLAMIIPCSKGSVLVEGDARTVALCRQDGYIAAKEENKHSK
ncbi:hypothetical protein Pyrde_1344 [Pyrodictium delaneyi]|uniref:Uncharacterized protein n=1 Tax=Pyrodictium delaneyi TaxID=1273541 RepID=A0A0P0N415_9CREN|nr:hypothetical protein [Pyrodictium delaneyi]ALL01390.1 hypothetical protein Pyrde_1344 [Pyrodictium delaneyi]OWJ54511.1 hypothetical protein Pdsh_06860 [Pyrodictium delaneyi]